MEQGAELDPTAEGLERRRNWDSSVLTAGSLRVMGLLMAGSAPDSARQHGAWPRASVCLMSVDGQSKPSQRGGPGLGKEPPGGRSRVLPALMLFCK